MLKQQLRPLPLSWRPTHTQRARIFSTASTLRDGGLSSSSSESPAEGGRPPRRIVVTVGEFKNWLTAKEGGAYYKTPFQPRNWIGGSVPFPLNRSFKPPTPVSDEIRSALYHSFMANPEKNSVRSLSERYHLSMKRVDAILRLKGLEHHMSKGKPLQTGFLTGMEEILGITQDKGNRPPGIEPDQERYDVTEADVLDEEEGQDEARWRYQRMFWEPVVENKEPIMPGVLEKAHLASVEYSQMKEAAKSKPRHLQPQPDTPTDKVLVVGQSGRPTIKFIDVGGKFIDVKESHRRMKASEHRTNLKKKRIGKREEAKGSKDVEVLRVVPKTSTGTAPLVS